ncbi:MAG: AMP-binding protein [Alphaproteobacteria bacterium]|jgi:acyl-CoA synthetase (AMP-forming)/AMP-acid ligase II|nr:AMP-binding protein [Alphaproteobacteria bacterium]
MPSIDNAQVFLPDLWATHGKFHPRKEAVVCGNVRRDWGEFDHNMSRVANRLIDRGIGRDDKVAVLMGNSVAILEVMFGVVRAGACVVPLSGLLTAEQLAVLIDDCDAAVIFVSEEFRERVDAVRDSLDKIRDDAFVAVGFQGDGWVPLADFIGDASDEKPAVRYDLGDDFNIIYSSGTTGLPKGIVQTHRVRQHWSFSNAVDLRFHSDARALTTTALYSNGTWLMVLPALFAGATLVVMPKFDPSEFLETVQNERITHSFMVPTQFIVTLADPDFDDYDLSSLEVVLCAGSPLRPDTKAEVLQRLSPNLYDVYGFSEGFATVHKPHMHAAKPDSVGTPVLGFDVKIIDDDGTELPGGEVGEIVGYGAGIMREYYKRPEQTDAIIWRAPDGRSFLRSGDIGKLDEDGFLYILDRKKDMIISGGFNVFPTDIEAIVGEHEDVLDVSVIGVPHDKWEETPLALVIPRDGAGSSTEDILRWANQRLAKHQRLSGVEFRDEFPRNALGKVLKRILREPYRASA